MKKTSIIIIACAALFSACTQEGLEEYPTPDEGASYVFEGTVNTPGFTWKTKSDIGIYSATEAVKAVNLQCKIEGWADTDLVDEEGNPVPYTPSEWEGKGTAPFNSPALDLIAGENEFFAYTPYREDMTYLAGTIYNLEIGQEQTQPTPNVASDCFAYGVVKGIPKVDNTFKFTLNPVTAMIRVSIKTTEFAGCGVRKIELFDKNEKAKIGGSFNVNIEDNTFNTISDFSKVTVNVKNPLPLETGVAQNFYVQALPGDYSADDMWAVIYLEGATTRVTMPVKISELKLEAGKISDITFDDLKSSDCAFKWFNPVEPRLQPALGYAYGDANTYLIQCKNGSTYAGGTYNPDPAIPSEVTIDFRARGNFSNAIDPTGATFEWFENAGATYVLQTNGYVNTNPTGFSFTVDQANYTVTVKNESAFAGAPILVMKKDGKTIWAWAFWNISADGTRLAGVKAGDYELANMDIGQNTTQFVTWAKTSTKPDLNYRCTYYYQWGRTTPVFWSSWPTCAWFNSGSGAVPVIEGQVSFAEALNNPVGLILLNQKPETSSASKIRISDWANAESRFGDLWGGNLKSKPEIDGVKAIYDPCPKGWRVMDDNAAALLASKGLSGLTIDSSTAGAYTAKFADGGENYFTFNGCYEDAVASNGRIATMGMPNSGAQKTQGMVWTNYAGSHNAVQPHILYYGSDAVNDNTRNRGTAIAVRCQKDTDNR